MITLQMTELIWRSVGPSIRMAVCRLFRLLHFIFLIFSVCFVILGKIPFFYSLIHCKIFPFAIFCHSLLLSLFFCHVFTYLIFVPSSVFLFYHFRYNSSSILFHCHYLLFSNFSVFQQFYFILSIVILYSFILLRFCFLPTTIPFLHYQSCLSVALVSTFLHFFFFSVSLFSDVDFFKCLFYFCLIFVHSFVLIQFVGIIFFLNLYFITISFFPSLYSDVFPF